MKSISTTCSTVLILSLFSQTASSIDFKTTVSNPRQTTSNSYSSTPATESTAIRPRRYSRRPPPQRIVYPGMPEAYNTARYEAALKGDAALEMWARGITEEEFGLMDITGGYLEPFRDHELVEESIQIVLNYWRAQSIGSLSPQALRQLQADLTYLAKEDVINLVAKEWRRRGYKGENSDIDLAPLLGQSQVLPAVEAIGGVALRDQVRQRMLDEYEATRGTARLMQ